MSKQLSMSEIKAIYQAADESMLPDFISRFIADERKGVQDLIEKADKRLLAYEREKERMYEMLSFERKYSGCEYICGIDEAGRGPLAGPVVAAAVVLPKDCDILYLNDSKQLSAKKRDELFDIIKEKAVAYGVGYATPERIDEINILQATYEAMREAVNKLSVKPDILLNDAVTIPGIEIRQVPIIKGDAKSASIAAASILAKVTRDRLMLDYDQMMPQYGFASNKGYGSAMHIRALEEFGASPIHRRSFITHFKVKE